MRKSETINIAMNFSFQKGYIALITVLIVMAVVLTATSTLALLAIGEAQSGFALFQGENTLQFVEGCTEDALLKIRANSSLSGTFLITRPEGTCSVTIASVVGARWVVTITTQDTKYVRSIQIVFDRNPTGISLVSWKEI